MTKYLIGLSGWLHGYSTADLNSDWVWWLSWDENIAAGHMPQPALLWVSRQPAAILSALAVAVLFGIVYQARGLGAGLTAALLLGVNPLVLLHGRRAMAEGALLFFSLLAVWGMLRLAQAASQPRQTSLKLGLLGLGVGALTGLAICS
jgi:dolichyl-phosphate-mannose--protein O-mannosyl transferase